MGRTAAQLVTTAFGSMATGKRLRVLDMPDNVSEHIFGFISVSDLTKVGRYPVHPLRQSRHAEPTLSRKHDAAVLQHMQDKL